MRGEHSPTLPALGLRPLSEDSSARRLEQRPEGRVHSSF